MVTLGGTMQLLCSSGTLTIVILLCKGVNENEVLVTTVDWVVFTCSQHKINDRKEWPESKSKCRM